MIDVNPDVSYVLYLFKNMWFVIIVRYGNVRSAVTELKILT